MNSVFAGRACRGKYYVKNENGVGGSFHEFDDATFLGFGDDYEEFESGPAQYTTAIVVLPDGRVATTAPEHIQFIAKKRIQPEKPLTGSVGASKPKDDEIPSNPQTGGQRDKEEAKKAKNEAPSAVRVFQGIAAVEGEVAANAIMTINEFANRCGYFFNAELDPAATEKDKNIG